MGKRLRLGRKSGDKNDTSPLPRAKGIGLTDLITMLRMYVTPTNCQDTINNPQIIKNYWWDEPTCEHVLPLTRISSSFVVFHVRHLGCGSPLFPSKRLYTRQLHASRTDIGHPNLDA